MSEVITWRSVTKDPPPLGLKVQFIQPNGDTGIDAMQSIRAECPACEKCPHYVPDNWRNGMIIGWLPLAEGGEEAAKRCMEADAK